MVLQMYKPLNLSQVRRSLLELLKSCGLPWNLTSRHILTALLNLGLNPVLQYGLSCDLACSQDVLPGDSVKDECDLPTPNPHLPTFILKYDADKHEVRCQYSRAIFIWSVLKCSKSR